MVQAKLTISLAPFQEKCAKLFQTIAVELWLRGRSNDIRDTFQVVARSITIRVAERLAEYICSLMRKAATLATPETECLLYESYWFRPILSELIGAATETATINRNRAPSGPVKVSVPTQPQERPQGGVSLTSGVAALLAWFPASWASKIAPCFLSQGGAPQDPEEVAIPCPLQRPLGCNELNETEFFKQSGSLIRKPQALTLVSTKTTKPLAASRKSYEDTRWVS